MSGGIEEPYTIAQLPKPLDAEHGRILAAPVHSLSGSRKRKRHEIAVGVDGESIGIYNTQNQTLSSSYPLPPQSYLAIPPCSVYCKRTNPLSSQRRTYFASRDVPNNHTLRLYSITEDLSRPQGDEQEPRVPAKKERKLRAGNIIGLDVVQQSSSDTSSVLVSYDNGDIDCILSDLSGSRWEHSDALGNARIEFATTLNLATARKGLLKNRDDILATLEPSHDAETENSVPLLLQVHRSESGRRLRLCALRNVVGDLLQSKRSSLVELLNYHLPGRNHYQDRDGHYELHSSTGMLYQQLGKRLYIFDLSGTIPKLVVELGRKGTPRVESFARLSSATVLTVASEKLTVRETKYGSVLSSLEYSTTRSEGNSFSLKIVSQFTELGIVVALAGQNLMAFQVGEMLDSRRHMKTQPPLLIDVLGKGSRFEDRDESKMTSKQVKKQQKWDDWKAKVDELVGAADMRGLESLIAQDLHIKDEEAPTELAQEEHDRPIEPLNGTDTSYDETLWELRPHTYDPQHTDPRRASYILRSLFTRADVNGVSSSRHSRLHLKHLSRNILRWLAMAGYLTHDHIGRALGPSSRHNQKSSSVIAGDVIAAIHDADPSFTTMRDLLSLPAQWDLVEVVQALQILIRSFEARTSVPVAGLLTDSADHDAVMINGDEETQLQAEVDAAAKQLDVAQTMLDTGLVNRSKTCQLLFFRLHAFPDADVIRTMKALLSQDELIFFIAILRLELSDAGWTRSYIEAEQAAEQELSISKIDNAPDLQPSNQAIPTIAGLYSCAVDAIGLSGWLVGLSSSIDETTRLINETRNEISVAAEGLVGAEVFSTLLSELIKTSASVQLAGHDLKRKRSHKEETVSEDTMLPLGGRFATAPIGSSKVLDGFKSKQAMAEAKSRNVGEYSFEQIRF